MDAGLIAFIAVVALNIVGLSLDLLMWSMDWPTVTDLIWTGNWWLGVIIIVAQVIGTLGLMLHFW